MSHDHDDPATLTVGCPACIARVQHDQDRAALKDAPVRRCLWRFRVDGKVYSFTLDVKVPAGWEPWQVDEEYAGDTGEAISDALGVLPDDDDGRAFFRACESIVCTNIGAIIPCEINSNRADCARLFDGELS